MNDVAAELRARAEKARANASGRQPQCIADARAEALDEAASLVESSQGARVHELEQALAPFARVLADVLPSPEERSDLENHGFDPDEGIPHDLGHDAPTVGDYRRAARVLEPAPAVREEARTGPPSEVREAALRMKYALRDDPAIGSEALARDIEVVVGYVLNGPAEEDARAVLKDAD